MSALPRISIIVPAYNAAHTIGGCLEALLAQDYPSDRLEILAVDNRSTDGTGAVMGRYPVRVLSELNVQSSYAARNTGFAAAQGEVLLFTDADCLPDRGWARTLVAALDGEETGGVAGRIEAAAGTTLVERFQVESSVLSAENALSRPALPFAQTANAAYRRVVFERVGLFDPSIVSGGDLDFSWRMQRAGWKLAYAPDAIVRHRHRTTFAGLVKLYAKNGHGAALLGERYPSYAVYQSVRVPLCRVKEMAEDLVRFSVGLPGALLRRDRYAAMRPLYRFAVHLGDFRGWLRWRLERLQGGKPAVDLPPRPSRLEGRG